MSTGEQEHPANCLNCQEPLDGNFCSHCGQSAKVGRITFQETFGHFLSSAFSFDGPFVFTIKSLLINPGHMFREYLAGKRKSYYRPVALFVLLSAIYIVLRSLLGYDPLEGQQFGEQDPNYGRMAQQSKLAAQFMVKHINKIMFFQVFSIALVLKLFFRKRYNLAEYTSIGFFITSLYIVFGTVIMLAAHYLGWRLDRSQMLVLFVYVTYCTFSLVEKRTVWMFIKSILTGVLSTFVYIIFAFFFSLLMISLLGF